MNHHRVCLIGCGGTIAMERDSTDSQALRPARKVDELLAAVPGVRDLVEVESFEFGNKDSTNMQPSDWTRLARQVNEKLGDYDAFVITHGTDTMHYTAGALALAFGKGLDKPIVFTGSQLPLHHPGSDGRFNLENAFLVALEALNSGVAEVMISFAHSVLRGCRARKRNEVDFDAFESPACPPLAHLAHKFVFAEHARRLSETMALAFRPEFRTGVFHIRLTPGILPEHIEAVVASGKVAGLILESFGAGNVPDDRENNYTLIPTISTLVSKYNLPIVTTTSFIGGRTRMELYQPGKAALDAGAIGSGDLTTEMAAVKLMWLLALGMGRKEIAGAMTRNEVGEVTPDGQGQLVRR